MNSVVVLPEELRSSAEALIEGERAAYLYEFHALRAGLEVRAAELGGLRGKARVLEASAEKILLALELKEAPLQTAPVTLIVAIPRPQTVKKVLQAAAMLGAEELHFVPSEKAVKSYIQSRALRPENIRREVLKGLEQSCDSRPVGVFVWPALWRFIKEPLPKLRKPDALCFLPLTGLPDSQSLAGFVSIQEKRQVLCAIGPEAGWSTKEEKDWLAAGFRPVSLGHRMLRVETALTVLLGQIELLRGRGE